MLGVRLLMVSLLFVILGRAFAGDLALKTGENFSKARQYLVASGWKPVISHKMLGDMEKRSWGDARLLFDAGFDEIEYCSGTGREFCFFNYRTGRSCLRVTTAGEYRKELDSPKILRWKEGACQAGG